METKTVGDHLYWCYANLAMAHAAVSKGALRFGRGHFIIRNRVRTDLRAGTIQIGPLADDERLKLTLPQACAYCGTTSGLSIDHLVPRKLGGINAGENMVWACRRCNSSKGAVDVLEWFARREAFPPLLLLRRYLKLAFEYFTTERLMDETIEEVPPSPFTLEHLPRKFPAPEHLVLWVVPLNP